MKKWIQNFGLLAATAIFFAVGGSAAAAGDLVGYWNFDEATGTNAADASGNANHGTFVGSGATHSTVLPPTSCFINTHSVQFDGSGDHVEIADNATMDPTNAISISFWMNPDSVNNGYQHVLFKQGPVVTSYGVWLANDHVYMESNDNSIRSLTSNATVTAGDWHYITVTYDGTEQKLYIDGTLDNSQSLSGITLTYTNSPVKIGTGDYNNPFAGYVDDLRIYNRALTAGEIADLAAGGCGPGVVSNIVSPTSTGGSGATTAGASTATAANTLVDSGMSVALTTGLAAFIIIAASAIATRRKPD
ncbi:LamG domain-containing protein [Candidatus Saccharibacteria bacterium]|nr:MAG: LamG domain-containing protein [Candidatus Saccharibacteria bacterium]